MKRLVILAIVIAVVAGGWFGVKWLGKRAALAQQKPVQTAAAEARDIQEAVEIVGEVGSAMEIEIKSEVSARITKVHVASGDMVKQKQVLVTLDRSELDSQREELVVAIESARLRVEKAKLDLDRLNPLFKSGLVTDKDFKDGQITLSLADNELKLQRAKLQTLDQQLVKTTIYAPMDGMVIQCDAREGQVIVGASSVSQGTVLMKLAQLDRLRVKSNVNEVDAVKLAKGMKAVVTFDSIPGLSLDAVVETISPSAQTKENKEGIRESIRLFPVEIACNQADPRVKLGISANVKIPTAEAKGAVSVSVASVFQDGKGKVLFVKKGESFEKRPIEVGLNDLLFVEIKKGVTKGELVALTYPPDQKAASKEAKK